MIVNLLLVTLKKSVIFISNNLVLEKNFNIIFDITETKVDERTKQNFIACLTSLRLLSKFLGYLTALPYKSESAMMDDVINSQVALRSSVWQLFGFIS